MSDFYLPGARSDLRWPWDDITLTEINQHPGPNSDPAAIRADLKCTIRLMVGNLWRWRSLLKTRENCQRSNINSILKFWIGYGQPDRLRGMTWGISNRTILLAESNFTNKLKLIMYGRWRLFLSVRVSKVRPFVCQSDTEIIIRSNIVFKPFKSPYLLLVRWQSVGQPLPGVNVRVLMMRCCRETLQCRAHTRIHWYYCNCVDNDNKKAGLKDYCGYSYNELGLWCGQWGVMGRGLRIWNRFCSGRNILQYKLWCRML